MKQCRSGRILLRMKVAKLVVLVVFLLSVSYSGICQSGISMTPADLKGRLGQISYLVNGGNLRGNYFAPTPARKGQFFLEYRYQPCEPLMVMDTAKSVSGVWESLMATYGLGDSARFFDTLFVRFTTPEGKIAYPTLWAYPLSRMKKLPTEDSDRLMAVLGVLPFDYSARFTSDSICIYLYMVPCFSPSRNLAKYCSVLSYVIMSFVFDRPKPIISIYVVDKAVGWVRYYVFDPADLSERQQIEFFKQ